MDVKLQSEVRPPPKATTVWLLVSLMLALFCLGIYGMTDWYFPKSTSWWLAIPGAVVGVVSGVGLERQQGTGRKRKESGVVGAIFVTLFFAFFAGLGTWAGVPSLLLRLQGPGVQLTAAVREKKTTPRKCWHRIRLAEYARPLNSQLCVSAEQYARLREGSQVVLVAREGYFGTFAFSLRPADEGPE